MAKEYPTTPETSPATIPETSPAASAPLDMATFAGMIGAAVTTALDQQNPKKVSFGSYTKRRNALRPKLTRLCFENGIRYNPEVLSNREIELLNAISRTGRYINRLVEVILRDDTADVSVELRWNCKSVDQRFENSKHWRSTEDMLQQIVDAQKIENQEDAERDEHKAARRHFGDSAVTRAARAAAGV